MFPPFPLPGFAPDLTGFEFNQNISWYETYQYLAQKPDKALAMVSSERVIRLYVSCIY